MPQETALSPAIHCFISLFCDGFLLFITCFFREKRERKRRDVRDIYNGSIPLDEQKDKKKIIRRTCLKNDPD